MTLDTNYTSIEMDGDEEEEEEEEFVDGEVEGEEEYDMNEEEDMYDEDDTEFFNSGWVTVVCFKRNVYRFFFFVVNSLLSMNSSCQWT